jgi:thiosulfate dehydrogenase
LVTMKKLLVIFFLGVLFGIPLLPAFAYFYFRLGHAPVATAAAPLPFEKPLARMALKARIAREAPHEVPVPATPDNLLAGAQVYREYCSVCHGMVGQPKTATAKGMFPPPPQLLQGKGVTDDSPGETYWKAANGIRLTGMPSYRGALTDTQLWQVSQLLATARQLPPAITQLLSSEPPAK